MPPNYAGIQPGYRLYQDRVMAGLADAELDDILEGMAEMERAELMPWSGLQETYAWEPTQIMISPPFIVGVPVTDVLTVTPLFVGGAPGGDTDMDEETLRIDRFVAGGIYHAETVSQFEAMRRAFRLYRPLKRAYKANGTIGNRTSGTRIIGATYQTKPIGQYMWVGLAVHTETRGYYDEPPGPG